ncbi:putative 1,2-alpha-mannosidase [Microdochium bolleyi]|uniref:alpha-1,2-Mannosidase n=1 Tax=Microdochium bolleyi TaxID=196109 RepID=A0A136JJP6_9PEZI|nr:putative 1,2-alpha-mannosidase [Microdochium bolleyi]
MATALSAATGVIAAPAYKSNPERADAVKAAFQRSWDGYYEFAFPHDTLKPISKTFEDDRNGWGASAVDALSTALIMGKPEVVQQILKHIATIDWNKTAAGQEAVSVFETTIRYLGGLLSGYDFLKGPLANLAGDFDIEIILNSAKRLGDVLANAFETNSGIPHNTLYVYPNGTRLSDETTNGIATTGTLIIEWTRLSDLTGDPKYHELAQKAEDYLLNPLNPEVGEPWPGLIGTNVYISNGTFADSRGGWNGGTDSFYEYLVKMYLYDSSKYAFYLDRWIAAADSSIKYLASHPTSRPELTYLAAYRGKDDLNLVSSHLACFDGGNFILGGLTLKQQKYIDFGLDLAAACHETYVQTATKIGPESFRWKDDRLPADAPNNPDPPADQAEFYARAGFWITSSDYVLRPEVIESFYYAYRATGDTKYQDWAWDAFLAIDSTTSAGVGYSSIENVNVAGGGGFTDFQESFWFAEVLKYSYLIQADDQPWQINADKGNQWVWNTEAHPVRVAGPPS